MNTEWFLHEEIANYEIQLCYQMIFRKLLAEIALIITKIKINSLFKPIPIMNGNNLE